MMPTNVDRQSEILSLLDERKRLSVGALARALYTSEPTVRRDLAALAAAGLIERIHGGAAAVASPDRVIPEPVRQAQMNDAKERIAREASTLLTDGAVVFLDGSTSASRLVPYLARKSGLIVVTSGAKTAVKLAESGVHTVVTGGEMLSDCYSLIGEVALSTVADFHADYFFFSCRSISDEGELTDLSMREDELRRAMMRRSERVVLLADASKLGRRSFHHLASLSEVDDFICDADVPHLVSMTRRARKPGQTNDAKENAPQSP